MLNIFLRKLVITEKFPAAIYCIFADIQMKIVVFFIYLIQTLTVGTRKNRIEADQYNECPQLMFNVRNK